MTTDAELPETINGRYRVVRLLGQGGMGQVLLVEDSHRRGRRLALKTLLPDTTAHTLTDGFKEEFAQLAKLEHPNLARAFDFGRIEGGEDYFFTTEYIRGVDLLSAVREASMDQRIDASVQILRALDFIHGHGLLHNDLKPANILVEGAAGTKAGRGGHAARVETALHGDLGRVRLIDFGLISREHTARTKILGTLRYLPPERIRRETADRRSDLYSLGALLYVLFARRPPFTASSTAEMLRMHLSEPAPPIRQFRKNLPDAVVELIHRLLEKRPEDRFASAAEALEFLRPSDRGEKGEEESIETTTSARWSGGRLTAGALLHRDRELNRLRDLYDRCVGGTAKSHAVILQGSAGTGKTRLAQELRGQVQVSGGAFVEVGGFEVEGDLGPVADAVLSALQTSGVKGIDRVRSVLRGDDTEERDAADMLCQVLLDRVRKAPILFLLDDLERASRPVRQFVVELLHAADSRSHEERVPYRLLIVIARHSATGPGDLRIGRLPLIQLGDFSGPQCRDFLESVFSGESIPAAIVETVTQVSRGNPLLLLELANGLVSAGVIGFSGARWRFPERLGDVSLPESLDDLFRQKVEAIRGTPRRLLEWIAIAGAPLPTPVLARCAGLRPLRLRGHLEVLRYQNLITTQTDDDATEVHQLTYFGTRARVLEGMGEESQRHHHQRIAQNIEEAYPDWEERADVLADHWSRAGNEAGFLRFAPRAAEILRRRGDYATAVAYRARICRAVPETALARKLKSLVEISEMHEFLWDLDACQADLRQIIEEGRKVLKPEDRGMLHRRLAVVELARFRHGEAEPHLDEAAKLLAESPELQRLTVDAARVLCDLLAGRFEASRQGTADVEARLRRHESPSAPRDRLLAVAAANHLATVHHLRGQLEEAIAVLRQNLVLLDGLERIQAEAATRCALGSVLLDRGEWEESRRLLKQSLAAARSIGDRRTLCRARERLGEHNMRFAEFGEAYQVTQVSLRDAEDIASASASANSLRTLGRIYEVADEQGTARVTHRRATGMGAGDVDPLSRGLSRLRYALFLLSVDDPASSRREVEELRAEVACREFPLLAGLLAQWRYLSTWKERGELDREAADEAHGIFERHGYRGDLVDWTLARAEVEVEAGRTTTARELLSFLRVITEEHTRPDLKTEASCILARALHAEGETESAASLLARLGERARDQRKLALERRCRELLDSITTPA